MDRETAKDILRGSLRTYLEQKGIRTDKPFRCLHPDHIDSHPSMSLREGRQSCHCFACGANADIFQVIQWDYGVDTFKEAFEIGCDLFGLSVDGKETKKAVPKIRLSEKKEEKRKGRQKASADICDKVYKALKAVLPLMDDDIQYLKEARHLSDGRIKADYFRLTGKNLEATVRKVKKLTGIGVDVLKTVPGFYEQDGKILCSSEAGIGILIRDEKGRAHAVQVRRDTAEKDRRYTWFTSSFAKGGVSPGAAKDVLIPEHPKKCLCITEGRFKAEVLAAQGNITVSVQGVTTWKGIEKIAAELKDTYGLTSICLMFDADVMGNPQLMRSLRDMAVKLEQEFPDMQVLSGIWKASLGKGVDDCCFNGHSREIRFIRARQYYEICLATLDRLKAEYGTKAPGRMEAEKRKAFKRELQERNEAIFFSQEMQLPKAV